MEFLSLQDPPEAPPGPRLTRAEAIGLSVAAHALLLLLFLQGSRLVPEPVRRWLEARPRPAAALTMELPETADDPAARDALRKPPETRRIPLQFAYVKVPNDVASAPNKDAALLSDKDRRARQEVPTPPDVRQFTRDPHSEGDSLDRVRPDPSLREGPDAPSSAGPRVPEPPPETTAGLGQGSGPRPAAGESAPTEGAGEETAADEAMIVHGDLVPPGGGAGPAAPPAEGEPSGRGAKPPVTGRRQGGSSGGGARRPSDLEPRTEYKFQFNNPGWLKGGGYGTMSFDTQGFPWGDYARQLYVAIRNNWLERIPLAAREGIAGYTCQHFIIAREGAITELDVVRPSEVPPFTKAASDAINASSPLPPLPADFPNASEGVTFCFFYNMYPGEVD